MLGVADEVRGNALLFDGGLLRWVLVGDGYLEMHEIAARWWEDFGTCGGEFLFQHQPGGRHGDPGHGKTQLICIPSVLSVLDGAIIDTLYLERFPRPPPLKGVSDAGLSSEFRIPNSSVTPTPSRGRLPNLIIPCYQPPC